MGKPTLTTPAAVVTGAVYDVIRLAAALHGVARQASSRQPGKMILRVGDARSLAANG